MKTNRQSPRSFTLTRSLPVSAAFSHFAMSRFFLSASELKPCYLELPKMVLSVSEACLNGIKIRFIRSLWQNRFLFPLRNPFTNAFAHFTVAYRMEHAL